MKTTRCASWTIGLASTVMIGGCSDAAGPGPGAAMVQIAAGPSTVRQGDVASFTASVTVDGVTSVATIDWSVEPPAAGRIETDGRFVAYEPGVAKIVAEAQGARAERDVSISDRGLAGGTFTVVGRGPIFDRFTSDLWVNGTVAYTGTWSARDGPAGLQGGNIIYVWDISSPSSPRLTDSITVNAGTVNDVKIREDGRLAALSHEDAGDLLNGITLLDLTDPLHPTVITRFTDSMHPGVHNLWIDGDFVYAAVDGSNANGGLRVIDASDPTAPSIVASFYGGDTSSNFGQFLHDVYVRDGLAFLSHWDPGLIILDVGNGIAGGSPSGPIEVGRVRTAGGDTHNAWYWPASGYVFVGEEDFSTPGKLHVVDARVPSNPVEVATFTVPSTTPHNVWLDEAEEVLYVGWYEAGVYAIDVSGELLGDLDRQGRVVATALYDGSGTCRGGGTCSWAPQLQGGNVWVADVNSGLWALSLDR